MDVMSDEGYSMSCGPLGTNEGVSTIWLASAFASFHTVCRRLSHVASITHVGGRVEGLHLSDGLTRSSSRVSLLNGPCTKL